MKTKVLMQQTDILRFLQLKEIQKKYYKNIDQQETKHFLLAKIMRFKVLSNITKQQKAQIIFIKKRNYYKFEVEYCCFWNFCLVFSIFCTKYIFLVSMGYRLLTF